MINPQQLVDNALKNINEISIADLAALKDQTAIQLVDIREANEVAEGVVPGSIWIPRGVLEFKISSVIEQLNWDPEKETYLYCRSGNRSALAAMTFKEMGFKNPISVTGGYIAWCEAGFASSQIQK